MQWYFSGAILIGGVLVGMLLGMPVAFAFLGASIIGVLLFMGGFGGLTLLIANASDAVATFTLVPIPLFVLMGSLFFHSGLAVRLFDAVDVLLGSLPGRLSYLTVIGGTLFSTLSGSSVANTSMLGALLTPQMESRGYKKHMSMGPVIGTGGLAMIIPPSALAVLLGSLARIDIGALLVAGILPGILLAASYMGTIYLQVLADPSAAPSYQVEKTDFASKVRIVFLNMIPMSAVVFSVVGLILLGIATPSEAAAFGVAGVLALALLYRLLTLEVLIKSVASTLKVSAMILMIIIGSATFSQLMAFSGASSGMIGWISGFELSPLWTMIVMLSVVLFLGMLMEQVAIIMLTIPVFIPLAQAAQFDPVWFGILYLLALEVSLMTPPFGLGLFVMLGVSSKGTKLSHVALAAVPYIVCNLIVMFLIILFPRIATYLPSLID